MDGQFKDSSSVSFGSTRTTTTGETRTGGLFLTLVSGNTWTISGATVISHIVSGNHQTIGAISITRVECYM